MTAETRAHPVHDSARPGPRHPAYRDPACPVDPFRAKLYSPFELYRGLTGTGYASTADSHAYTWSTAATSSRDGRARPGPDARDYADAAELGRTLADAGRVVLTGGGPGAMEAANLGALSPSGDALAGALIDLALVPGFTPSIDDWALLAMRVRDDLGVDHNGVRSIGVPTWFYGHEPPNIFCNEIAKHFSNALREDVLLSQSSGGLAVLPEAAGAVQEIFQASTSLYYTDEDEPLPPLVLVGNEHWTTTVPVWPALRAGRRATPGRGHPPRGHTGRGCGDRAGVTASGAPPTLPRAESP